MQLSRSDFESRSRSEIRDFDYLGKELLEKDRSGKSYVKLQYGKCRLAAVETDSADQGTKHYDAPLDEFECERWCYENAKEGARSAYQRAKNVKKGAVQYQSALSDSFKAQQIGSGLKGYGIGAFGLDWETVASFLGSHIRYLIGTIGMKPSDSQ
ncbi:hypothetical protein Tco_1464547, partial [Tanacetum coccineum]